ncbi:ISWI chromatin-remodeling complex ATPase CHR11-like [Populus alba x Populus x berolinensis]|uniref:ISWI chromatin-remodeling complex ATPase CHR11-like n=1 Tax=Populus alba x Populus x berolinensis TaxID=444605 RepID=A0AAD6M944_9ROSI|nr:ISWI chromatin-remodeling complex ATPase CHR11-like [Populus alba x Populus x berolinensis]
MAKPSKQQTSSDEAMSSDEEPINEQISEEEDEEEIEAVARSADSEEDEAAGDAEGDEADEEVTNNEISKRERERLKEMQILKKHKIQEILDQQNAAIDADMNNKGKGRLKYLLQQTELFAHFAKHDQSSSQKKAKGRGRHASKVTEEEEDEECLKEEEDGLSGNTRLVTQPSCKGP